MLSICAETVSPWGSLGDITAMMVSNNPSFRAQWEPYSPKKLEVGKQARFAKGVCEID